jgi:hypothetical protein
MDLITTNCKTAAAAVIVKVFGLRIFIVAEPAAGVTEIRYEARKPPDE